MRAASATIVNRRSDSYKSATLPIALLFFVAKQLFHDLPGFLSMLSKLGRGRRMQRDAATLGEQEGGSLVTIRNQRLESQKAEIRAQGSEKQKTSILTFHFVPWGHGGGFSWFHGFPGCRWRGIS